MTASDADGSVLFYEFTTDLGTNVDVTGNTASVVCEEGLTTISVTVSDGKGGSDSESTNVTCNVAVSEVKQSIVNSLGLVGVVDGGSVSGVDVDFTGTTTDGTRLAVAYDSSADFTQHNDVSARGTSGTAQRVISIAKTTDSSFLPTSFEVAQDLLVISNVTQAKMNPRVQKVGTGDENDICVTITAEEAYNSTLKNIAQSGDYLFEGRDLTNSTLTLEGGEYTFQVAADGHVELTNLAQSIYDSVGPGVTELLNAVQTNSDEKVNDACDTSVTISPFTNTNPTITIDEIAYSHYLEDGTTPRDVGTISVTFTANDIDEPNENLVLTADLSSDSLVQTVELTLNETSGQLEAALTDFGESSDGQLGIAVNDSNGGTANTSQSILAIHKNTAPYVDQAGPYEVQRGSGVYQVGNALIITDLENDNTTVSGGTFDSAGKATGQHPVVVIVTDEFGAATNFEMGIDVLNTAPEYADGLSNLSCDVNETITIPTANFTDVNGDSVTVTYSTSGSESTEYTCPDTAQTVSYYATGSDGEMSWDSLLFDIVVNAANNAPVITTQPSNLGCTNGDTLTDIVSLSGIEATDADGDSLTLTPSVANDFGCVNSGTILDPVVTQTYNVQVTDGTDAITSETRTIYVCPTGTTYDGADGCF